MDSCFICLDQGVVDQGCCSGCLASFQSVRADNRELQSMGETLCAVCGSCAVCFRSPSCSKHSDLSAWHRTRARDLDDDLEEFDQLFRSCVD